MKRFFYFLCMTLLVQTSWAVNKNIRIGTEGAYEPFNYMDAKGQLLGFDIDIAKALCKEMKVSCQFVTQSWDGIIPGLLMKKYDAIVASMSVTDKRKQKVLFTHPYYNTPARYMVKKGSTLQPSIKELKGKTLGIQRGTTHHTYANEKLKGIVDLKLYNTQEEANLDLLAGRLDAVLADSTVLYNWVKNYAKDKVEFRGDEIKDAKYFGEGVAIALRKSDSELAERFNKALDEIQKNGTYDKIRKKYFPFEIR